MRSKRWYLLAKERLPLQWLQFRAVRSLSGARLGPARFCFAMP